MRFLFVLAATIVTIIHLRAIPPLSAERIILATLLVCGLVHLFYARKKSPSIKKSSPDANHYTTIKREALARIPKRQPRRPSVLADACHSKVSAIRNMAELIRKNTLRRHVLEICNLADIVSDTIYYMPSDTPSASAFAETLLEELYSTVEHCFEVYRCKEYSHIKSFDEVDTSDLNHFDAFITSFSRQQRLIIEENGALPSQANVATP